MLFDSQSEALVRGMERKRPEEEERQRRADMLVREQLLRGDIRALVAKACRQLFKDPAVGNKFKLQADVTSNLFKTIIEDVYRHFGAERRFLLSDGSDDPTWADMPRDDLAVTMADAFLSMGAQNDCLVHVLPSPPGEPPYLRTFRAHEVSVVADEDDPSQPLEVRYERPLADGTSVTVVWTPTEHFWLTEKGKIVLAPGQLDTANPLAPVLAELGMAVPFVPLHKGKRYDSFWDRDSEQQLVDSTIQYGAAMSALNYQIHAQHFSQPVVTGAPPGWTPPPTADPGILWVFHVDPETNAQPRLEAVDLGGDLGQILEARSLQLSQVASSYGISRESLLRTSNAPASGFARLLERASLIERRKRAYPFLQVAEVAVMRLVRALWNLNNSSTISEDAVPSVEIVDEPVPTSAVEREQEEAARLGNIATRLSLGLISRVEAVAEERGVSPEEAARIVREIDGSGGAAPAAAP